MIENAISEFAARLDMPSFSLNDKGIAALQLEDESLFTLEKTENELLLYLTIPVPPYEGAMAERVLELSHYRHNHAFPLFTGFYDDKALFLTRFVHTALSAAIIENAFVFLIEQSKRLKG